MIDTRWRWGRTESDTATNCRECGTALAPGLEGLCPKCLLGEATAAGQESEIVVRRLGAASVTAIDALFPDYEVLELIGAGGMGAVYKARQSRLERFVAIKVLHTDSAEKPEFAERFVREARTLARLEHPNIVTIYDYGERDGFYYFVMEFVDGADLAKRIRDGGITPELALRIVPQICDALEFAHEEGVTHRDIKPGNILLDAKERVRIVDFGVAKLIGVEIADLSLTATGTTMGSARYMAPEQWDDSRAVDHRADIFSLGVVFYEMLTGELPSGRAERPSQIVDVPKAVDEVVFRAMKPLPDARYQRVGEVKEDLDAALAESGAAGGSRAWRIVLVVAGAAVLGGILLGTLLRWDEGSGSVEKSAAGTTEPAGPVFVDLSVGLPPDLQAMKERGGRLRAWGRDREGRNAADFIMKTGDIDDFTSVQVHLVGRWVAQRRDGRLVSQVTPFEEAADAKMVENEATALVTNAGEFISPDTEAVALLGEHVRGVKDFEFAGVLGGVYYVTKEDGSVRVFVKKDPGADSKMEEIRSVLADLDDVVEVAADGQLGIVLREDGTVLSWHLDTGFVEPPPGVSRIERIACGLQYYMALTSAGRLKIWTCYPVVDAGAVDVGLFEPGVDVRAKGHVYAVRQEDGSWGAWAGTGTSFQAQLGVPEEVAEQINRIGRTVDIAFVSEAPMVLWIEPAGE